MRLPSLTAIYLMKSGLPSSVVGRDLSSDIDGQGSENSGAGALRRRCAIQRGDVASMEPGRLEIADLEAVVTPRD